MNDEQDKFLTYWFDGFINGLRQVDGNAQDAILRECGLACARSFTARAFQEARRGSDSLEGFLIRLAEKFPGTAFEAVDEQTIRVSYAQCYCDLVKQGWVKSPLLCKCSTYNLKQNFEGSLGRPVRVKLISSILGGAEKCSLEVVLLDEDVQPMENHG